MLIESSWGLGEAVVSGLVQPDTLVLDRAAGAATSIRTSDKKVWIPAGSRSAESQPTPVECVKVAYRQRVVRGSNAFWQPVEWMVKPWLPGWLIVYLVVYLPAMFVLKWSLRVP